MHYVLTSSMKPFDESLSINNNHRSEDILSLDQKQIIFYNENATKLTAKKKMPKTVHSP